LAFAPLSYINGNKYLTFDEIRDMLYKKKNADIAIALEKRTLLFKCNTLAECVAAQPQRAYTRRSRRAMCGGTRIVCVLKNS